MSLKSIMDEVFGLKLMFFQGSVKVFIIDILEEQYNEKGNFQEDTILEDMHG